MRELTYEEEDALEHAIEAAREEESISFNIVTYIDFTNMTDDQIEEWLLATEFKEYANQEVDEKKAPGNLFADEGTWEYFVKADDNRKRQAAWDALVANMAEKYGLDNYGDMWESKKHKKYSSFKNQQTIIESFRRFLKK